MYTKCSSLLQSLHPTSNNINFINIYDKFLLKVYTEYCATLDELGIIYSVSVLEANKKKKNRQKYVQISVVVVEVLV